MSANILEISEFINNELSSNTFTEEDYSLNGLQLNFNSDIKKIAASVDIGIETLESAKNKSCQLIIAHHGIFWKKSVGLIANLKQILDLALKYKISIIAQHLPLDASVEYGNNFSIARALGLGNLSPSAVLGKNPIGCRGENISKTDFKSLIQKLETGLAKESMALEKLKSFSLNFGPQIPEKICVVSGSGCEELYHYKQDDFDTLITGEPRQFIYHFCKDNKLNVICAGHYATETLGVKNITEAIAKNFKIDWEFIDEPTGI